MAVDRRRFLYGAGAVGGVALGGSLLAACGGGSSNNASTSAGGGSGSGGARKSTLTVATSAASLGWDPDSSESNPSLAVWGLAYDSLFDPSLPAELEAAKATMTPDNEPAGLLAQSWESRDGREWILTLRDGAVSNHGNRLTAEDVVWSLQRPLGIAGLASFFLGLAAIKDPEQIRAVDSRTVSLRLDGAAPPYFLKLLALPWLAIYDATEASRHRTADDPWAARWLARNTAGFGPFKVGEVAPDGGLATMERNADYWGDVPADAIQQQIFQYLPEDGNRLQLLLSGDADVAEGLTSLQLEQVEKGANVEIKPIATAANFFLGFNNAQKPFDDPEVRRAVARVMPYEDIIQSVYRGQADRWKTVGLPPWFEAATDEFWEYDSGAEEARAVLASVREPVRLTYTSGASTEEQVCVLARQALVDAGLNVELEGLPRATTSERRRMGRLQFFADPWDSPAIADSFYALKQLYTTDAIQATLNYKNPEIDAVYDRGVKARGEERTAALVEAQRILVGDLPMIPIAWTGTRLGAAKNLEGFRSITTSIMWLRDLRYS